MLFVHSPLMTWRGTLVDQTKAYPSCPTKFSSWTTPQKANLTVPPLLEPWGTGQRAIHLSQQNSQVRPLLERQISHLADIPYSSLVLASKFVRGVILSKVAWRGQRQAFFQKGFGERPSLSNFQLPLGLIHQQVQSCLCC